MKEPVQAGTLITEEMIEAVKVPEGLLTGTTTDVTSAVGKYTSADLFTGDYLTDGKLLDTLAEQDFFSAGTQNGMLVVSITLPSLASGVSGKLEPGDIVTVIALAKGSLNQSLGLEPTSTEGNMEGAVVYPELRYLEVCMISANDGSEADVSSCPEEGEKNNLPVAVSFYTTEKQALRLAELEQRGIIHLAFVARGEDAARYIPDNQRVLNKGVE